ncbi:hypothetical protein ES705_47195 [subsurface metagenome]
MGLTYTYDVEATDPDEDTLTYSLTEKPLGMAIVVATGVISWDPTDAGVFPVGVKVSDPDELFDVQVFRITVVEADEPEPEPELVLVGIVVDPDTMDLIVGKGEDITSVTATYVVRAYEGSIALEDCLFLTSNDKVATVEKTGADKFTVTAEGVGKADIIVSYKGEIDTIAVTVDPIEVVRILAYPDDPMLFTVIVNVPAAGDTTVTVEPPAPDGHPITQVMAYYNDKTHEEVALTDCDLSSDDSSIGVTPDGVVTVTDAFLAECIVAGIGAAKIVEPIITVEYEGKTDTIAVKVTVTVVTP